MRKKVLAMFIVMIMVMQMIPVYAEVVVGGANKDNSTPIYTNTTQIQLGIEIGYFKFTPTINARYTIATIGTTSSDGLLQNSSGIEIGEYSSSGADIVITADLIAYQTYYLQLINFGDSLACTLSITGGGLLAPIDTTPPEAPVIIYMTEDRGISNSDRITSDNTITINGTSEPSSLVSIYQNEALIGSTLTNTSGVWAFDYRETVLSDGVYTFKATATDAANNTSPISSPFVVTVDTVAPTAPLIISFSDDTGISSSDRITNDRTLILNGTAENSSIINVMKDDIFIGTTNADSSGNWSFDYTGVVLNDGTYTFTATSSDVAGNTSAVSSSFTLTIDTLPPLTPFIGYFEDNTGISPSDYITNDNKLVFYGLSMEPYNIVNIYKNSTLIGTTAADTEGSWSFDYTGTVLSDGVHCFSAIATDLAGNTSFGSDTAYITIDTTAPEAPAINSFNDDTGISSNDRITKDNTLILNGTAENNCIINIMRDGHSIGTTVADASGNWSYDYTGTVLSFGTYTFTATSTDVAGNVSPSSDEFLIKIDYHFPAVVSLTPSSNATNVNVYDNFTITFSEYVYVNSGSISLHKYAGPLVEAIDITSDQVTGSGTTTITINPTNTLEYNTRYYIQYSSAAFGDAAGNLHPGIDNDIWNFTTEILEHTVTFVDHNGVQLKQETVENGGAATAPSVLPREGYTFNGWDVSFSNVTTDLTVTTQWDINEYTISFDSNGGSTVPAITQDYGTAVTAPTNPTRTGYTFAGWTTAVPSTMPATNMTITAQWDANEYTINFDSNGGSTVPAITQDYGTAVTAPANPIRAGYSFAGWTTAVPSTMPATNMTITAIWNINSYTITFDSNGGSAVSAITQDFGTAVTAPVNPTRTGYTFTGWTTTVPSTMPATNMTITAQWDANEYTINFDSNGGSTVPAITQDFGTAVTAPANPIRAGYSFAGWTTAVPSTMPATNMTITAIWNINSYTITFDSNGGSAVSAITQDYGTAVTAPVNPTRTGYTFAGWDTAVPVKMPAGNMTITAQWELTPVQKVINGIIGLPDAVDVNLVDGELIKLVIGLYNELSESEKLKIPSNLVSSLNLAGTAFAEIKMVDNSSGLFIKSSDGTILDPNLELVVKVVEENSDHNIIIEQTFGDKKLLQVFDISLMLNGQTVQPSGTIRVSIPIPADLLNGFENHKIVYIAEDGTATIIPSTVEGNMIWFETDHFSDYGIIADAAEQGAITGDITKTGESDRPYQIIAFLACIILSTILLFIRRKMSTNE